MKYFALDIFTWVCVSLDRRLLIDRKRNDTLHCHLARRFSCKLFAFSICSSCSTRYPPVAITKAAERLLSCPTRLPFLQLQP